LKGFIPKARFDEVNEANKQFKTDLADRNTQLEELKKTAGSSEELKKQINDIQEAQKAKDAANEAKIKQMQINVSVERELLKAGIAGDLKIKAAKALLDLETAELDGENVKGLADQLKKLQESEDSKFLFTAAGKQQMKGFKPEESGDKGGTGITKEQFARMGYKDKVNLFNTNKELYDSLTNTN
jgi:hypothetical protein